MTNEKYWQNINEKIDNSPCKESLYLNALRTSSNTVAYTKDEPRRNPLSSDDLKMCSITVERKYDEPIKKHKLSYDLTIISNLLADLNFSMENVKKLATNYQVVNSTAN